MMRFRARQTDVLGCVPSDHRGMKLAGSQNNHCSFPPCAQAQRRWVMTHLDMVYREGVLTAHQWLGFECE
jgi:hypothetical protein